MYKLCVEDNHLLCCFLEMAELHQIRNVECMFGIRV